MLSWDSDDELMTKCLLLGMKLRSWGGSKLKEKEYMVVDLEDAWMFFPGKNRIFYKNKREALKGALEMYYNGAPRTKDHLPWGAVT